MRMASRRPPGGPQGASKIDFGWIFHRFLEDFWSILGWFFIKFWFYFSCLFGKHFYSPYEDSYLFLKPLLGKSTNFFKLLTTNSRCPKDGSKTRLKQHLVLSEWSKLCPAAPKGALKSPRPNSPLCSKRLIKSLQNTIHLSQFTY